MGESSFEEPDLYICGLLSPQGCAGAAALLVGAAGLLPLAVLPFIPLHARPSVVRVLLSAACGALLANAWIHILPEALEHAAGFSSPMLRLACPGGALAGVIAFFVLEKTARILQNGGPDHRITGYLTILVNMLDNVAHGIALSAAFGVSCKVGVVTVMAVLLHEIPHEIGDYAIVLNAGLSLSQAVLGQLVTSCGGLLGVWLGARITSALLSLVLLSFTAGGFVYIALSSLVPVLNAPTSLLATVGDFAMLIAGIASVALAASEH